jgi:hypothetical protein
VVLYWSVVPLAGSYVFKVSVARGGSGFEDSAGLGRDLEVVVVVVDSEVGGAATGGALMVYLVVMRVCVVVS